MSKWHRLLRHDVPTHFFLWLTNGLPDWVLWLRLRGALIAPFLGTCGRNLRLGRNVTLYNPSQIRMGHDVYLAYGCWLMADAEITLHNEVMLGPYTVIASSNHTRKNGSFRYGASQAAPVRVGSGCWIASHVTVTAGTTIGAGSLIAANAVITQDIPANCLAAGQPAQVVRYYAADDE